MPHVETHDGARLFYNDWGSGRPVVLIHGWPVNSDMWDYQATVLALQGYRVVAYDRRGFGRSTQTWTGYDYDTLSDDLNALLEALDLTDVSLVGFSMGGGEVARYFSRHGAARIAKAVFVSAVTPFLLKTDDNPDGVDRATFDEMIAGLEADRPAFLAAFGKMFFGAGPLNFSVSNEILAWAQMLALQASPKATLDCVRAFSETDFRADLATIKVPTLIVHGDGDKTVPIKSAGQKTAQLIPHAVFKTYPGAPHGLFFTDKDQLNADLLSFLAT